MKKTNNKYKKIGISVGIFSLAFLFNINAADAGEISPTNVIELVNKSRNAQGLSELKENEKLDKIARAKLLDMIENNYFAHTSPKGINPWFWYEKNGYDYKYAGENLAINFLKVEDQHRAWMESPTHRKNILNANYQEIGVAVEAGKVNGQMAIITVQEFGTLSETGTLTDGGKNFSGKGNENLIREGTLLKPQILSAKNQAEDIFKKSLNENVGKNYFAEIEKLWNGDRALLTFHLLELAAMLLLSSVMLSSITFLAVAADKIMECEEARRAAKKDIAVDNGQNTLHHGRA